ncbi:tetratricopeptide repeat protein [Derxia lacustris]|uniref:tetratricopeptide repeat protein n=1 Tax=Derxia lacustris TaxID=764842 RepID=UPI00111C1A26|nr:hypothetical protein [Derxia lacustris]
MISTKVNTVSYRICLLLPVLLAILAYLPVFENGYVWDDDSLFVQQTALRSGQFSWATIAQPILPGTTYFRPLVLLSYFVEFTVFGVDPGISHGINLLLHIANILLVGMLTKLVLNERATPVRGLVVCSFYAINPVLVEPVAWAAGRFDLMVTTFFLAALCAALIKTGVIRYLLVVIFFLAAAFSKEMAVTFPVVALLLLTARSAVADGAAGVFSELGKRHTMTVMVSVVLAGSIYLSLRWATFHQMSHIDAETLGLFPQWWQRLALVGMTLLLYVKLSVWPFSGLNPLHPGNYSAWGANEFGLGIAIAVLAAGLLLWIAMRRQKAAVLLIGAWLVALMPVLNIIPLTIGGNLGHERFLCLPLVFFLLAFFSISGIPNLSNTARSNLPVLQAALVLFVLAFGVLNTNLNARLWNNAMTLWTWAYEKNPDFMPARLSLVSAQLMYHRTDEARALIDKGELGPYGDIYRGGLEYQAGNYSEAALLLDKAAHGISWPHDSIIAAGKSVRDYQIENATGFGKAWLARFAFTARADTYIGLHRYPEAVSNSEIALFYAPDYPPALLSRAIALYGSDRLEEAREALATWKRADAGNVNAMLTTIREKTIPQLCADKASAPVRLCATAAASGASVID